ncbi:unnamed protein product, partial [Ectocarpus sp. 4 AP-2014]
RTSAHTQAIGTTDRQKQGARGTCNGVVSKHELGHGGVPASSRNGGGPPARTGGGGGGCTRGGDDGGGHQGYGFPPGPHGGVQHRVEEQPDVHHVHHRSLGGARVRLWEGRRQHFQLHQQGEAIRRHRLVQVRRGGGRGRGRGGRRRVDQFFFIFFCDHTPS